MSGNSETLDQVSEKDVATAVDPSVNNVETEGQIEDDPLKDILENLCILPPRQKSSVSKEQLAKDAILLPPLLPSEPVAAIRAAIAEIKGYAHLTNYRLEVEELEEGILDLIIAETKKKQDENIIASASRTSGPSKGKKKNKKGGSKSISNSTIACEEVVSPYTSRNASIKISVGNLLSKEYAEDVLNDYEDLSMLVADGILKSNMGLRIVLETYNVGSVKDHVEKTRFLLEGNIPFALGVTGAIVKDETEDDSDVLTESEGSGKNGVEKEDGNGNVKDKSEEEKKGEGDGTELNLPDFSLDDPVELDTNRFEDFFYLACGEEDLMPSKGGGKQMNDKLSQRLWELDEKCRINCKISFGGFNPPPMPRKLLGDLAYLEVTLPGNDGSVHITVVSAGFYVNKTVEMEGKRKFDPSPASNPCFSHELLDCLLLRSKSLRYAWASALEKASERSELTANDENPARAVLRAAVQGGQELLDQVMVCPSWLVPRQKAGCDSHEYSLTRLENNMADCFGLDLRSGAARDWNEEFQSAREMPKGDINERIERARMIHKVLSDFGDAAVTGVMTIAKGQISPMNPNENSRSHVYLHNNIFFSMAIDSGLDTFKLGEGDRSARKSASRDARCVGMIHKLDISGLNTLATVLVDYLGSRLVCQSIVPGILLGEKTHKILYGAVDATSPLAWDESFHEKLNESIGKSYMVACRKVLTNPLTEERLEAVNKNRPALVGEVEGEADVIDKASTIDFFGSVEMKGIQGSDLRSYCLDVTRLTPRDANWVPQVKGGTGNWENSPSKGKNIIPHSLDDDEWVMAVLRPELIIRFVQNEMRQYMADKKKEDDETGTGDGEKNKETDDMGVQDELKENLARLKSLRFNLNVFLPHLQSIESIDNDAFEQLKKDENLASDVAKYLWEIVLPQITKEAREKASQLPFDGRSLTTFLHERGVNCRYLGRLATLAIEQEAADIQEEKDIVDKKIKTIQSKAISNGWLELLECEMVARAAKHVLNDYLVEAGGIATSQPSRVIAAFLSALMTSSEESAAETEHRLAREKGYVEDITLEAMLDINCDGIQIRGHHEVWSDISKEIGRRFRYKLRLYNSKDPKNASRAALIPLLRRVCERTGTRLYAKNYDLGTKGLYSMSGSYPIDASDVAAVVPMVKHAASSMPEFVPCANGAVAANSSLFIMLPDAKQALETATLHLAQGNFNHAFELSQEATNLFQRVTDSPLHVSVAKSLDLTTLILFQAQELDLSASHAAKALAISIQLGGFDSANVISSSMTLFQIMINSGRLVSAVKYLRSVAYLVELLSGPHHTELMNCYYRIGQIYAEVGNVVGALRFYQAAQSRKGNDRVFHGLISKQTASICAKHGELSAALDAEKVAYRLFGITLGEDHEYTQNSKNTLQRLLAVAVEHDKNVKERQKKLKEEAAANAIGEEIIAKEMAEAAKKKKKKNKSKSKKKR